MHVIVQILTDSEDCLTIQLFIARLVMKTCRSNKLKYSIVLRIYLYLYYFIFSCRFILTWVFFLFKHK